MKHAARSPRITDFVWGRISVGDRVFKDAKLWPGGAREWDWTETGTRHEPGIQPADVAELLEHGAVERYNELAVAGSVGGLFHSTC